jgi:hypothetical protein
MTDTSCQLGLAHRMRTGVKTLADICRSFGWISRPQESNIGLIERTLHDLRRIEMAARDTCYTTGGDGSQYALQSAFAIIDRTRASKVSAADTSVVPPEEDRAAERTRRLAEIGEFYLLGTHRALLNDLIRSYRSRGFM